MEHWHAATGTAWIAREPASPYHERPSRRLAALVERVCQARGSDAACFGGMDLRVRQEDGTLGDFMQADETVYLHPSRSKLPQGVALMVGEDGYPDVVLEVDNTTDVRRGKLVAYAEWGFPEVWVEVPDLALRRVGPRGLHPGLVIHLLEGGRYVEAEESSAFPGWRADGDSPGAERAHDFGGDGGGPVARGPGARRAGGGQDRRTTPCLVASAGGSVRSVSPKDMPGDSSRGWPEWPPRSFAAAALRFPRGLRRNSPRGAGYHRMPFSKPLPRRQTRRTSSPG